MIDQAAADAAAQADPDSDGADAVKERYPKAVVSNFDGDPSTLTEMDAMVAYLQMLGTLVDFKSYDASSQANQR
jgi:cytochrome c oxidase cbb3-type subunit 2